MPIHIEDVFAWEALDSRGRPTVACAVRTDDGTEGSVVVPSGASTGTHEAVELRDGGMRYGGYGVLRAVEQVNTVLGPAVKGYAVADQRAVDERLREIDGTTGLGRVGANAVLAVSLAVHVAARASRSMGEEPLRLPMPMFNILSGGAHADRAMDVQDLLVIPVGATSAAEAVEWGWQVRAGVVRAAKERGLPVALVADEGGLGPPLDSNRAGLELLMDGIGRSGLHPGDDVAVAIDVAASQFHRAGTYTLRTEGRELTADEWLDELLDWLTAYPIVSLEDPFAEDDWPAWTELTRRVGDRIQIVGDDLLVTSVGRLRHGLERRAANAILVKPNQVGTVSDAAEVVDMAHANGVSTVVSARSGDTEDRWLVDLAVDWKADQLKVGSLTRSERTAKWNRLLRLEADPALRTTFRLWPAT